MTRRAAWVAAWFCALCLPLRAHAFPDDPIITHMLGLCPQSAGPQMEPLCRYVSIFAVPASNPDPDTGALHGGGDGRYFTGSPADGFTCKVCHSGGKPAPLKVLGLPLAGYKTGSSYEITVDWPDDLLDVAMTLEISDDHGVAAGTLQVPPMKELLPSERCHGKDGDEGLDHVGAGQVMLGINRVVIDMPACGARQLRFLWTAPPDDRGAVRITGSFVNGNDDKLTTGDGVTDIARVVGSHSDPSAVASHLGGCSVSGPRKGATNAWWAACLGLVCLASRRHLRPTRRPSA
jgi:hypothetical protein